MAVSKNNSFDALVNYLTIGSESKVHPFSHKTEITVNLEGLKDYTEQYNAAVKAFNIWEMTTGIDFKFVTTNTAEIKVDNEQLGSAYADTSYNSSFKGVSSTMNVGKDWMNSFSADQRWGYGSYGLQTFIHEIGHVLGLEHPGDYNGNNANYATDALFTKDSYQYTVMSYFTQSDYNDASDLYLMTPMLADYAAIREIYGSISVNAGNTVYGKGETVWGGLTDFSKHSNAVFTLNDSGGQDVLDFSNVAHTSYIDLRSGHFSNVNGYVKNVAISYHTVIEVAKSGAAGDTIIANDAGNKLYGGAGNDHLVGGSGADRFLSGKGNDILIGNAGADTFYFRTVSEANGDTIKDFVHGLDKINVHDIDANRMVHGNQDFTWIGSGDFTHHVGELHMSYEGNNTIIEGDSNADGTAEFTITLNGHINLTSSDFLV
jgi:serralysin